MSRIRMVVDKGCLRPADDVAVQSLRARHFGRGEEVWVEVRKPRNPRYHRLAHALGTLAAENLDAFEGMDSHAVLKRLQLECGIGCDEVAYRLHGMTVVQRIPQSLSFESMDQSAFEAVYKGMCRHLGKAYFGGMNGDEVAAMVELMPSEVA